MTIEQGWLHALLLAHLWKYDRRGLTDREAARLGLQWVRECPHQQSMLWQTVETYPELARPSQLAVSTVIRAIHKDAWASRRR